MSPLEGVRVLDLSRLLPGPFASLVLADMGASVDKVEEPGAGDYLRHMPPTLGGAGLGGAGETPQSSLFLFLNRNKRSLSLDLKKPAGQAALRRLLARYDVLLEQFRPGVLARLGLAPEDLLREHPALIVCSLTGYGQTGDLSQRAGHDINYVARAGALFGQGPVEGPPTVPGTQVADIGGGLWSVIAILGALAERARTGRGKHLDVSMLEASMSFAAVPFGHFAGGVSRAPGGAELTGGLVGYGVYATKDRRAVSLGALEPKFLGALFTAVGKPFDAEAFALGEHQEPLRRDLASIFLERTLEEWVAFAKERDVCLEPVLSPAEAVADAHLASRGAFFRLPSPWGELLQMRLPVTDRAASHRPPPRQGEHSAAILREAGFSDAEIAELST